MRPAVNAGRAELLDEPRLAAQLVGLEGRVPRGGKDSVDHAPGGHVDLAKAAGALVLARAGAARAVLMPWFPRMRSRGGEAAPFAQMPVIGRRP